MPTDAVIVRSGPVAVPLDYQLPTGTEIVPKVVTATLNGTSAGGSFLAVLEVISPNGTVTARCLRQVAIAAGASAAVSWFPGGGIDDSQTVDTDTAGTISTLTSILGTLSVNSPTGPTTNVDMPATGVAAGNYGDASDAVTLSVDLEGRITAASSVPIAGGGAVVASDGWVPDATETWIFASFTAGPPAVGTFTVTGDVRAKYTVGTRIKLDQTTTKFFVVTADPTFAAGATTVTISGGTDYTLVNAAITANYHSYLGNPQGYPGWFNFAPAYTGWNPLTTTFAQFGIANNRVLFLEVRATGTSNSTSSSMTLPVAPNANRSPFPVIVGNGSDNGGSTAATSLIMAAGSTTANFRLGYAANASWTAAGAKTANVQGSYGV